MTYWPKVLQVKKSGGIKLSDGYPRMADFAELGEIISRCMGNEPDKFLDAYYRNIDLQVGEAIESNPVGSAIVKFMDNRGLNKHAIQPCCVWWKGTSTDLLDQLELVADDLRINTYNKLWPKCLNSLSRRITEVKTNLREMGISVEKVTSDHSNRSWLILKVPKVMDLDGIDHDTTAGVGATVQQTREVSPVSPVSPEPENQARNEPKSPGDISGDIVGAGDINKVSPENNGQNRAHIASDRRSGGSGDIIRTEQGDIITTSSELGCISNDIKPVATVIAAAEYVDRKMFKCYYCDERFSSNDNRRNHRQQYHPDKKLDYPTTDDFCELFGEVVKKDNSYIGRCCMLG